MLKLVPRINGNYKISEDLTEVMNKNPGKLFRQIIVDTNLKELDITYIIKILNNTSTCVCSNYEDVLFINELVNAGRIKISEIQLKDDLEMKDRSYIDFSLFKNTKLTIPSSYYMWGVKNIDDSKSYITQESITEITRIVSMIAEFPEKLTDVEKIILIANYIQQYCEYIDGRIDRLNRTGEEFELVDNIGDNREVIKKLCHNNYYQVGTNVEEPLFENYATCSGFAKLVVLFLNNPYIKIKAERVSGEGHAWNVVLVGDKYYNLDVTRAITYSPYRAPHNLRTLRFNSNYVLVGTDFLEIDGHEKRTSSILGLHEESKQDFDRDYINFAIEHLKNTGLVQFEYQNDSFYKRESRPIKR